MLERLAANLSGRGCSKLGGVVFATRTTVGRGLMGRERCANHDANTKAVFTAVALLKSGCFFGDPIATIQNFKAFFQ